MASGLGNYNVLAAALDKAEAHLQALGAAWSLREELGKPPSSSGIDDAEISQPVCTVIQLALVVLLKSWGVVPDCVTGHSSGEIAAAYAAGLISFRAAIAISYFRGQAAAQLARQQPQNQKGAMLALGVGPEEAAELITQHANGYATVTAINSPRSVTISGDQAAVENVQKAADDQGLFARRLKIQMAYHSRHMEEVASFYLDSIRPFCDKDAHHLASEDGSNPLFVSSVTGNALNRDALDGTYWVKNLVRPVKFADAIQAVFTAQNHSKANLAKPNIPNTIVEIGPHAALKNPIKQTVELLHPQQLSSFVYLPSLVRSSDAHEALLTLAGALFTLGAPVELGAANQTNVQNAQVVTGLPAYAWDKSASYQLKPRSTHEKLFAGEAYNPLLERILPSDGGKKKAYRQVLPSTKIPGFATTL